jgi:hypothetical protein
MIYVKKSDDSAKILRAIFGPERAHLQQLLSVAVTVLIIIHESAFLAYFPSLQKTRNYG